MGVYDFNIPRYNIDGVIDALRKELQSIVINSQTSIDEIKQRIADDEVILNRLKDAVNNLPDYSAQYNELYEEMARIKIALQDLIDHPIVLEDIQVGLTTEVQKINGQYLYANHAVSAINDFSGRNIVDTYATKDELSAYISGTFNEISAVSSELTDIIDNFSADTNDKFNNIENTLTEKTDYLSGAIDSISGIVDTELDNLAYKIDTVSGELKSDIEAVDNKIDAVSAVVDEKYEEISATIDSVSANFDNIFDNLNYKIDQDLEGEISARFDADTLLQSNLDDEISARFTADTLLQSNIHDEEVARISADNNLQAQIDTIEATQNIVDIVGTKADLDDYDTRNLKDGAKIQVLDDETQNHASTIYQFNKYAVPEPSFGLVGTFGSYYTKSETDTKINTAENDLTELLNIETSARSEVDTTLSNRIDALDLAKQDNLTAGDGIDITNDVVSHSVKVIENNNEEDTVDGTVFTVYLKNNHYKVITISKTITEIIFMIEKTASGVLQETGFEFTVPEDSDLETLTFKVIDDNNKKIYTIIPDSYTSPNIYQGTIVNYRCTIGEYEVED